MNDIQIQEIWRKLKLHYLTYEQYTKVDIIILGKEQAMTRICRIGQSARIDWDTGPPLTDAQWFSILIKQKQRV